MKNNKNYSQPEQLTVSYYSLQSFSGLRLAMIPPDSSIEIQKMYFVKTETGMRDATKEEIELLKNKKPINL